MPDPTPAYPTERDRTQLTRCLDLYLYRLGQAMGSHAPAEELQLWARKAQGCRDLLAQIPGRKA